jgi:endonuclease YncB( thermonuclease family)
MEPTRRNALSHARCSDCARGVFPYALCSHALDAMTFHARMVLSDRWSPNPTPRMKHLLLSTGLRMAGLPRWAARALSRLLLIGAVLGGASQLWAAELAGRVVGVSDGDTITVLTASKQSVRVRLQGIDAPESHQAFGSVSKRALSGLVFGKHVSVRYDTQDRYGRVLGVVYLGNEDVNLAMVRDGMAWHYKFYARDQSPADRQRYALAEEGAQTARIGLWRDANPTPPWDFRRAQR